MRQEIFNALCDKELLAVREYHMDRLTRLFNGEKLDKPFFLAGIDCGGKCDPYTEPEKWVEQALVSLYENAERALDKEVFRPLSATPWLFGVHFTDKVLGCKLIPSDDLWWTNGLDNEIGELSVPDLETNETWRAAQRVLKMLVGSGVTVPFFTSQVLGEPWNQTFNIYRERGLYAFYDDPEGMKRDLSVVTDMLVQMHKWYIKTIPPMQFQPIVPAGRIQPRGFGQMCGCSTHMISHALFEKFLRENDQRILDLYPNGGMYHLCGTHLQHVPSWVDMPKVRAFQLNDRAQDDFAEFYKRTREDQIFYVNARPDMPVEKILDMTDGGRRCVIVL